MAGDPSLLAAVTRIFCSEIDRPLQRLGEERGVRLGASGLVASIQLFGGSLNLNPHQHVLGLDGVYSTRADGCVVFTPTRAPAQSELLDVTQRVHKRVLRWLKRPGAGDGEDKADDDERSPAASCAQLSLRLGKLGYVDSDGVAHEPGRTESSLLDGVREGPQGACDSKLRPDVGTLGRTVVRRVVGLARFDAVRYHGLSSVVGVGKGCEAASSST